jgi:hypothetical protein
MAWSFGLLESPFRGGNDADFDITNWLNIAEENCYAMLCLFDGNRV